MMNATGITPFLCNAIDKALIRSEWEKWHRAFCLYLEAEDIQDPVKRKNKLLHLGGMQLQEVVYNIPGALVDSKEGIDVFKILVDKLHQYFSPKRNSTFERHLFRALKPEEGENLSKFILRLRNQAAKCQFGEAKEEVVQINLKDKLIDAWATTELRKRLLEKEYSLDEIIDMCQVYEQIKTQSETMILPSQPESINKITPVVPDKKTDAECSRCGRQGHTNDSVGCPAKKVKCNKCNFVGHFARMCKTRAHKRKQNDENGNNVKRKRNDATKIHFVAEECKPHCDHSRLHEFDCFKVSDDTIGRSNELIDCFVGGQEISMLIDSGSRFNLLTENDWNYLCNKNATIWNIRGESDVQFRAYAGSDLLKVKLVFESVIGTDLNSNTISSFYVIESGRQSLLGRDTAIKLKVLRLGIEVNAVNNVVPFPKVKGIQISLTIDESVKPVQQPLRRIPSALEEKVDQKLREALAQDIIESVTGPSAWISPVVIVFKEDGDIRLCIDMRRANKAILRENYPLPTFDSFMTQLKTAKYFSRLDLKNAYHQLELDESSREITTFITTRGLFRYKRLLFGVNSAPEIFQRTIENILAGQRNALNYLDDIIVYGETETELDINLKGVLKVFGEFNIELNNSKCIWKAQKLKFLGHVLSAEGINPDPEKVEAVVNFRAPSSKEEIRSFLGLVTYLGKFLPDLADTTEPLRNLVKKDVKFVWGPQQDSAFEKLKHSLAKIPTLSYFDPKRRTQVIADASPVALGAILLQFQNESPQVISFASKSLSEVERRYSQTEKESLALVWSVERFYYYLAGIDFELVTDHKPLEAIFKTTSRPPARIERWVLRLQSFKFKIVYRPGKYNIADTFSRLYVGKLSNTFDQYGEQSICAIIEKSVPRALTILEICKCTSSDPELLEAISNVKEDTWGGESINKFFPYRLELCTVGDILLRGTKIVIPMSLRARVLELAHEGHPGETVMKRRVRSKVWWPLIDRDVEKFVKNCRSCLLVSRPNNPAPMNRRALPEGPWLAVAMDLLGPLPNHEHIFVVIDYYSRYYEVKLLKRITSTAIIHFLDEIFSRLGYPKSITADNGRQFVSEEFKSYCSENAIELITSPPYWPQANGEVENLNRSLLKRLQIANAQGANYTKELQKFILMYNVTPHGTTGKSPSEMLFNRCIRDKIPSLRDIEEPALDAEARDLDLHNKEKGRRKGDEDRGAKESGISVGDKVLVRNAVLSNKLSTTFNPQEFEVIKRTGNDVVVRGGGKELRRNVSHLKKLPEPDTTGVGKDAAEQEANPPLKMTLKNIGGMWRSGNAVGSGRNAIGAESNGSKGVQQE